MLKRKIEEHGQETFYHIQSDGKVVDLIEHIHNFTVDQVTEEFNRRFAADASTNEAYDLYELDEITLSRMLFESLLSPEFYEKIFIRYGHQDNFHEIPGSVLVVMALETCNASVSHDIDGAAKAFDALKLDTYPGENITNLTTEALRLLKIMQGGYALPFHTGSRLLMKVTKMSSKEFNRKVFALLDPVKEMEYKYKVLDPKSIKSDPEYKTYGPVALISTLQQAYGRLISFHDWPALALQLPESNHASAIDGSTDALKCFRCQGPHLFKDCPVPAPAGTKKKDRHNKDKSKDKSKEVDKDKDSDDPVAKKARVGLAAWKYLNLRTSPNLCLKMARNGNFAPSASAVRPTKWVSTKSPTSIRNILTTTRLPLKAILHLFRIWFLSGFRRRLPKIRSPPRTTTTTTISPSLALGAPLLSPLLIHLCLLLLLTRLTQPTPHLMSLLPARGVPLSLSLMRFLLPLLLLKGRFWLMTRPISNS